MKPTGAVVVAACLVAGCATHSPSMMANDCKTTNGKCEVAIKVTEPCNVEGNIVVDPETLDLAGKQDVTITWELPGPYRFCRENKDWVMFKYAELDFQFTTPEYDDHQGGGCHKRFKWKDKNEPKTYGTSYSYLIQFTGPRGTCKLDPFIRNG